MSHSSAPSPMFGRFTFAFKQFCDGWNRIGRQTLFYATTLRSTGDALVRYRVEVVRIIAQMSFGTGALVLLGGTVVIVSFLTTFTGSLLAVQGYHTLSGIGVEALTGFISAFANPR